MLPNSYTYQQVQAPTISNVNPNTGSVLGVTSVTLTGTGFVPGASVSVGGIAATNVSFVNATTLMATTPAYSSGPLGKDVTINNGAGSATLVNGYTYTYRPTVGILTPNSSNRLGQIGVVLTGTNFVPADSIVTIGGVAVTPTSVTPTSISRGFNICRWGLNKY